MCVRNYVDVLMFYKGNDLKLRLEYRRWSCAFMILNSVAIFAPGDELRGIACGAVPFDIELFGRFRFDRSAPFNQNVESTLRLLTRVYFFPYLNVPTYNK